MLVSRFRAFSKMIVKPLLDQREYRHVLLPNKLEALLISDPAADKSAGALDVRVGSLFDPPKYQGLAHFLEHMLFLGTTKYPEEDAYQSYLAQHGGMSNAFTADNHTCYFFSVAPDHLKGGLDRFGQFFISPLFTQSATDREVKAVHSEHSKNLQEDMWRQYQLMREKLFDAKHPSHHFSTGNKETLDQIPRSALLDFHSAWYSANVCRVAVLGKESLDDLETMVREIFSQVANKDVVVPLGDEFGSETFLHAIADPGATNTSLLSYPPSSWVVSHANRHCLKHQLYVVPVKEQRSVQFGWFLPEQRTLWEAKPAKYLSHILGHEGEGSLTQVMKAKGIATDLVSGLFYDCAGLAVFKIDVHLTKSAADKLADPESGNTFLGEIASLVSAYVRLAKEQQSEKLWKEVEMIENLGFAFKATTDPMAAVQTVVNSLHYYPESEVLAGPSRIYKYDAESIHEHLAALSGHGMFITVTGKEFAGKCTEKERWYGTQYGWTGIDRGVMGEWEKTESMGGDEFHELCRNHALAMPEPNPFLPDDLDVLSVSDQAKHVQFPSMVAPGLFFKQDNKFGMPKGSVAFIGYSPYVQKGLAQYTATDLFVHAFVEEFSKTAYIAEVAGLKCKVKASTDGVQLSLGGYNDKLGYLTGLLVDALKKFTPSEKQLLLVKDRMIRGLQSQLQQKPAYNQAMDLIAQLLVFPYYPTAAKLAEVEAISALADIVSVRDYLFCDMRIEALIEGNFHTETALKLNGVVNSLVVCSNGSDAPYTVGHTKVMQLADDANDIHIVRRGVNAQETNGAVAVSVQAGWLAGSVDEANDEDLLVAAQLNVVSQICGQKFFDDLRTKQQLGYVVHSAAMVQERRAGLLFLVQSEVSTADVKERMLVFINGLANLVEEIPKEDFHKYIEAMVTEYKEKPKNQSEEFQRHWSEIERRRFYFDRRDKLIPVTEKLTQQQVVEFIRTNIIQAPKVIATVAGSSEPETEIVLSDQEIIDIRSNPATKWVHSNTQPTSRSKTHHKTGKGESRY